MEAAFNYLNFNYEDLRSLLQDLQEGHEPSKVSFAVFLSISVSQIFALLKLMCSLVKFQAYAYLTYEKTQQALKDNASLF